MSELHDYALTILSSCTDSQQAFLMLSNNFINRQGIEKLNGWLQNTDFFTAPASTRFHGAYPGGLVEHSINVAMHLFDLYDRFPQLFGISEELAKESLALVALYHDVCKANFYKIGTKNQKNEQTGKWEKVPFYQIEDKLPYGHGEKSVYLIEHFVRLKTAEAMAVRWHMGAFDADGVKLNTLSQAFDEYPLAFFLHTADMMANHFTEKKTENE